MPKETIREYRGVQDVYVARVLTDSDEEFTTDTPRYLAGASEVSRTTETSTEKKYYDNSVAMQVSSVSDPEITLTMSAVSNSTLAYATGMRYDETLDVLYHGTYEPVYVSLLFKYSDTAGNDTYTVFYKGLLSVPDGKYSTKTDDAAEGEGTELTYTSQSTEHIFDATGRTETGAEYFVANGNLATAKADLTDFYNQVLTPDTIKPVSTGETVSAEDTEAQG
jgi:phi13 family phage major tail protein